MIARPPRIAPDAEKAVLGSIIIAPFGARRSHEILKIQDFHEDRHRLIFEATKSLMRDNQVVDLVTLSERLRRMDKIGQAGGHLYLKECLDAVASGAHVEYYCRIVREASLERQIDQALNIVDTDRTAENLKYLGDLILSLQGNRGLSVFDMTKDLGPMLEEIVQQPEPGLKTGMEGLDDLMGPMKRGNLWTIGARPGGGKTALMLKIAGEMAVQGIDVLYMTTEMEIKEMVQRILPMTTGIPHAKFRAAKLDEDDYAKILDTAHELGLLPWKFMQKSRLTLDDIRGAIFEHRPKVVFIDYLQRCVMPKAENMAYQISEFYADLKGFLLDTGVIAFIGCQTDRELDRNPNFPPQLAHFKGSGGIEAESDGAGLLWEPPAEVIMKRSDWIEPSPGCRAFEFYIRKNRNGDVNVVADLELNGQLIKMCERKEKFK